MLQITVDTREVDRMAAWVAGLQNQLPYATSRALNDTAKEAAADLNRSTLRYFQDPTPFTQRGYWVSRWSTKADLSAELNLRPLQSRYLLPSIRGGVRPQRPSEVGLGAGYRRAWKPGPGIKLNRYGNIPKPTVVAALRGVAEKGGQSRYFQLDQARGRLWPGIYQRTAKGSVRNVLSFGSLPNIPQRWPVEQVARESIGRHWPVDLSRWLESSRPKA